MRAAGLALTMLLVGCQAKGEANTPPATPASSASPSDGVPPGPTPKVDGNHRSLELAEGKYEGDLVVTGNHNRVTGAGYGKTIIKGKLLMSGNHNTVSGVTIDGGGTIEGNHNDATKAQFHGDVTTAGNKNQ
jgi:hypothetical protein